VTAGKLDRRIIIERATFVLDAFGAAIPSWDEVATVWAEVTPISDAERWAAAEIAATVTTRFRIRWGVGVTVQDRIRFEGRLYDISGTKEVGRRQWQELTASARAEAP